MNVEYFKEKDKDQFYKMENCEEEKTNEATIDMLWKIWVMRKGSEKDFKDGFVIFIFNPPLNFDL